LKPRFSDKKAASMVRVARALSLRELVARAGAPAREAAVECHWEVLARLEPQARLAAAVHEFAKTAAAKAEARTLKMLVEGVAAQLRDAKPLLADNMDAYHRQLASLESRYAMFIATVVDLLQETTDEAALAALEALTESHVGAALLVRHQLQAHAGHLENNKRLLLQSKKPSERGVVDLALSLKDVALDAARDAAILAFAETDDLVLVDDSLDGASAVAVPHLLAHALLEIVKNAVNASSSSVRVRWQESRLVVEDDGPGLPFAQFEALSRLRPGKRFDRIQHQTSYAAVPSPLAGIKIGLFAAKVHAAHFRLPGTDERYLVVDTKNGGGGSVAELRLPNSLDATERLPDLESAIASLLQRGKDEAS